MAVSPNSEMVRADLVALVTLANAAFGAGKLLHGPFLLFNGGAVNDRGGWVSGSYNINDQVECDGYLFVSTANGNADRPLDASTGDPSGDWQQPWQSCYQRIRNQLNSSISSGLAILELFRQSVSGPWPCQTPSINYNKLAFYFEDTGHAESVTYAGSVPFGGSSASLDGKVTTWANEEILWNSPIATSGLPVNLPISYDSLSPFVTTAHDGPGGWVDGSGNTVIGQYILTYPSAVELKVVIGGTMPVTLTDALFTINVRAYKGWGVRDAASSDGTTEDFTYPTDSDDPTSLFTVDTSDWFSGVSFTPAFSGWTGMWLGQPDGAETGNVQLTCTVNGTFDPGEYIVRLAVTRGPNNASSGTLTRTDNGDGTSTYSGFNQWNYNTFVTLNNTLSATGNIDLVASTSVEVPGIDDHVRILKIAGPEFDHSGIPSGLYGQNAIYEYPNPGGLTPTAKSSLGMGDYWSLIPDDQTPVTPTYVKDYAGVMLLFGTITASTTGYWFGQTPPVQSLGMIPFEKMPWNMFPTTIPLSGANTATVNKFLGYILPYVHSNGDDHTDSQRAYDVSESPGWLTPSFATELLPTPRKWKADTHYPVGFTIIDKNGNLQEAQSPSGRSGSTEPNWARTEGATTNEPNYLDVSSTTQPGTIWKLTKQLSEIPTILRSTAYAVGKTGIDNNGNTQKCTVSGNTSSAAPTFAITLGANTVDGSVTWEATRINAKLQPAVARISPPIYPAFWHNPVSQWESKKWATGEEITDNNGDIQKVITAGTSSSTQPTWVSTLGATTSDGSVVWKNIRLEKPDLTDPNIQPFTSPAFHPFSFAPQGWWIYRVFLNRIPQKQSTEKPESTPIAVKLGCVRGGAFVSFGTFNTGTPVDAGWFVFTNTHLAYEANERVDVQAEIATCGLSYGMWGNVSYPMAAAHLNDMTSIIGLL